MKFKKKITDDSFSYKALMELKGSKCTCLPKFSGPQHPLNQEEKFDRREICGTYCKYLTPKQQKKVILKLIRKEKNRQMLAGEWEPKRYLIN